MLSLLLAVILTIGAACPASAADLDTGGTIQESDLIMPPEAAPYVAEFFVRDMIATGQTAWDETTAVVNTVTMYDETGETPTAYSVELTSGYVIVSAYVDVPNPILEWADEAEPVYANFSAQPAAYDTEDSGETKVVYLGTLNYLLDNGSDTLETVEGTEVERDDLTNPFDEVRDIANVPEGLMEMIENGEFDPGDDNGIMPLYNNENDHITSVTTYAKNVYGETWTNYDYSNNWESMRATMIYDDIPNHNNKECGPIAVTNIIRMFTNLAKSHGSTRLMIPRGLTNYDVYRGIKGIGNYFNPDVGVVLFNGRNYPRDAIAYFDKNASITTEGLYDLQPELFLSILQSKNMLMFAYYGLDDTHYTYGDTDSGAGHWVVGYAYTRFLRREDHKLYTFLKICDGVSREGRYLDTNKLARSSGFYEIAFNNSYDKSSTR